MRLLSCSGVSCGLLAESEILRVINLRIDLSTKREISNEVSLLSRDKHTPLWKESEIYDSIYDFVTHITGTYGAYCTRY